MGIYIPSTNRYHPTDIRLHIVTWHQGKYLRAIFIVRIYYRFEKYLTEITGSGNIFLILNDIHIYERSQAVRVCRKH